MQLNLDEKEQLAKIGHALSTETRIEILQLLCYSKLNINEIAKRLAIPPSTVALHVKVLEDAGLIHTTLKAAAHGAMKLCSIASDEITIALTSHTYREERREEIQMPIGSYTDYKVTPTCGLVSEKGPIGREDEPRCFYDPRRNQAKLLWLGDGYVEYRFPNTFLLGGKAKQLELSMEICSEDHEYNMKCPSDLTVWVNEKEVGTFLCPSDFGGRRGKWNPSWWPDKNTQYGVLKTWVINTKGTFVDEKKATNQKIHEFELEKKDYILVRIGIKENAKHKGGMNLFGDAFGDYRQDIKMVVYYG